MLVPDINRSVTNLRDDDTFRKSQEYQFQFASLLIFLFDSIRERGNGECSSNLSKQLCKQTMDNTVQLWSFRTRTNNKCWTRIIQCCDPDTLGNQFIIRRRVGAFTYRVSGTTPCAGPVQETPTICRLPPGKRLNYSSGHCTTSRELIS